MKDENVNGKRVRCYDNGGRSCDRYTVAYMDEPKERDGTTPMVGMNHEPFHPQGFGQHCSGHPGRHLGKRIKFADLPEDCRKLVEQDTRAASTLITGRRCPQRSWEKCAVWILSNGWTAWEQYGYYGPYLSSLEAPDGKHWQASNGSPGDQYSIGGAAKANAAFRTDEYIDLPEFAVPWRDADKHKLVRPKFKKECT